MLKNIEKMLNLYLMKRIMRKPKNKYGAKVVFGNGIRFPSMLEKFMYDGLNKFKIPFEFQKTIELVPSFTNTVGKKIRSAKIRVDFVIESNGIPEYVDTKGVRPPVSLLKYKMLDYKLTNENINHKIIFLQNKKEVNMYLIEKYNELKKQKNGRKQ